MAINRADEMLRSTNNTKRSFKAELRLIPPSQKGIYESDYAAAEQNLKQIDADLKALKQEYSRSQLFLGQSSSMNQSATPDDGDAMLQEAQRLQDKTGASLANTKRMVEESKYTGMQTVEELQRQREQIRDIDNDVNRLEDNLGRADKLVKTFAKRMATDRVIQCFACTNILFLLGIVIYVIVKGGGLNSGDKDSGSPTNPVRFLRG
jgi:chromosome segregation ATPase